MLTLFELKLHDLYVGSAVLAIKSKDLVKKNVFRKEAKNVIIMNMQIK